jgi:hypothetical protein
MGFQRIQAEIYLLKDALLLSVYVGFAMSRIKSEKHSHAELVLRTWALIAFCYFTLEIINPNSLSIILPGRPKKLHALHPAGIRGAVSV